MTQELGCPPNMVDFMIDTHKSKKTKTVIDKKAARIAESLKEKMDLLLEETQDGSVHSNSLLQTQVDTLFLQEIKGTRFGIGSLSVGGSSTSVSDLEMQEELQNAKLKIAEMEKTQAEQAKAQAKQAKEFEDLKNELVKYLPNLSEESDSVTEYDNR